MAYVASITVNVFIDEDEQTLAWTKAEDATDLIQRRLMDIEGVLDEIEITSLQQIEEFKS